MYIFYVMTEKDSFWLWTLWRNSELSPYYDLMHCNLNSKHFILPMDCPCFLESNYKANSRIIWLVNCNSCRPGIQKAVKPTASFNTILSAMKEKLQINATRNSTSPFFIISKRDYKSSGTVCVATLPWCNMDILEKAEKLVHQWDTKWPQDIVPAGLHVLRGSSLGITFTAKVVSTRCDNVWNKIIIATWSLK